MAVALGGSVRGEDLHAISIIAGPGTQAPQHLGPAWPPCLPTWSEQANSEMIKPHKSPPDPLKF